MARLAEQEYTYFTTVRGMCRRCRALVPARIFFQNDQVWQQSLCPGCETEPALIAGAKDWYLANVVKTLPDRSPLPYARPQQRGCPQDCGPCRWHASPCQLPVISITNDCNLNCPICFTFNRPDRKFFMSVNEMRRTVDWLIESSGPLDLINITGGEPTMHPQLLDVLQACKRPEIGRITMNSNGLTLAKDEFLCQQLAELDVCVVLSFNTFDGAVSKRLNGCDLVETKWKAIDNLTRAGVRMTLLSVLVHGTNENVMAGVLQLMRENDNILSLTVQTMTYTGQGGGDFPRTRHVPVDVAAKTVCEQSGAALTHSDFITRPSAHPLCYLICYMLKDHDRLLPLARLAGPQRVQELIQDSYLIRPGRQEFFLNVINELYADGNTEDLQVLRHCVEQLYPTGPTLNDFQRHRIAESFVRTIYLHAHMDEDNFDCSRAMLCPDMIPTEPGRLVPACTYNLFYRRQDERFYQGQDHPIVLDSTGGC